MLAPLYCDSSISVSGAICSIMQFCMTFKLTYSAIGELLKLFQLLCPKPNRLPATVYHLKKYFNQCQMSHSYHKICSNCQATKEECNCSHQIFNSHLIHIPIKRQLHSMIKSKCRPTLYCIFIPS